MRLDVNELNHKYIIRIVILAVFMHKDMKSQELIYKEYVRSFVQKRLGYDMELSLEVGPKIAKAERRDQVLSDLLDEVEDSRGIMNLVVVTFKTGFKDVNLQINLREEDKYENYIYG